MKVLMIAPDIHKSPGGMSTVIINYFNYGLSNYADFNYLSSSIEGNIIIRLIYNFTAFIKFIFVVNKYDIVHLHMAERGSFFRKSLYILAAKIFHKKILIHIHSAEFKEFYNNCSETIKKYIRYIFNQSSTIIVLSLEWKKYFSKITKSNITVLHNGINIPKINLYNTGDNELIITMMGRLGARKGVYDILEIASEVINSNDSVRFYLAGDGETEKVNEIIKSKNLEKYVKLLGWVDEAKREEIFKNTCVYLLPSYNEGMPMSILEAISFGIPVIASNIGGIPSIIKDGVNGFLINPGDIKTLKDKILYIINNKEERINISKRNYNLAVNKFSIEKHIVSLSLIYKSLIVQ